MKNKHSSINKTFRKYKSSKVLQTKPKILQQWIAFNFETLLLMKKTFVILLSLIYLVLASGFTQYSHLCKGMATQSYSLTNEEHQNLDKPCPMCAAKEKSLKDKKKDCCEHETKLLKVDDSVKKQSNFDLSVTFWGDAIPNKMLGTVFDFSSIETKKPTPYFSSKVLFRDNPLYILYCVYRI